jgi:hypothetical protein
MQCRSGVVVGMLGLSADEVNIVVGLSNSWTVHRDPMRPTASRKLTKNYAVQPTSVRNFRVESCLITNS